MATSDTYTLNVDADVSDAQQAVDKLVSGVSKKDVEIPVAADTADAERDIAGLLTKVDALVGAGAGGAANLMLTTNASQITQDIADLTLKLDTLEDPVEIRATVEGIAQLEGDLESIATKAKEINDTPINPDTSGATGGMREFEGSVTNAKSVMANMVGNASQDLGALGGVAGSAGVAIGQMGEYIADAFSQDKRAGAKQILTEFAGVVGPIAGITAGLGLAKAAMDVYKEEAAAAAERTDELAAAMGEAGSDAGNFADVLRGDAEQLQSYNTASSELFGEWGVRADALANKIPILSSIAGDTGDDIVDMAQRAGLSFYDMGRIIDEGGDITGKYARQVLEARDAGKITGDEVDQLAEVMHTYGSSARDAAADTALFNVDQEEANAILADTKFPTEPMDAYIDKWGVLSADMKDGTIDTQGAADAVNFLAQNLGLTQAEVIALAQANLDEEFAKAREEAFAFAQAVADAQLAMKGMEVDEGFDRALDQLNAASELDFSVMALNTVGAFDDVKGALKEAEEAGVDWSNVDLSPDSADELKGIPPELAAVTEAVMGMRGPIQTELAAAFDTGGVDAFVDKAGFFAQQITDQFLPIFTEMTGDADVAKGMVNQLLTELGLMPDQVQTAINVTRGEQALAALETFRGVIETMPEHVQVAINAAIAAGDIEGALAILNEQLIHKGYDPIVLPLDADPTNAQGKIDETVGYGDGAAATMELDANTQPAEGDIAGVEGGQYDATVDTDADTSEAKGDISDVEDASYEATVKADAEPTKAVDKLLEVTTRTRNATIYAVADANAADSRLDAVAGDRTSHITAVAHTGGAEAALNSTARARTSHVTQYVHTVSAGASTTTSSAAYAAPPPARARGAAPAAYAAAPTAVNVTINSAVMGDRYDIQRTVMRAVKSAVRLSGARL